MAPVLNLTSTGPRAAARLQPCPGPAAAAPASSPAPGSGAPCHSGRVLPSAPRQPVLRRGRGRGGARAAAAAAAVFAGGEIVEVEALKGIRAVEVAEGERPRVEYLVAWKDGSDDTWCVRRPTSV